ncbi:DUF6976 family protein [Rhodoferax saidenbachensis]|uniref:Uncharacterized protein n=1 Tax=Rhodoferax saidenbachensis TaxID=1484693 RepID=A0ABU1ZR09_9BURK|nr:hypothetical protein [Rhodoferax saidenbachensis]MDR7307964.1 hypothetical protein [Rhodoferax saidenbachensis]
MNELISIGAAAELIRSGASLSLAGPESALDQLPTGNWIGGTIPYFMVVGGGTVVTEGKVFATDLSHLGEVHIACYGPDALAGIVKNAPDNGFSLTIIPAGGQCHQRYAAEASNNPDAFLKPTVGWISGVHLSDLGRICPKVYDGRTATKYEDRAVVAYVGLPADKMASLEIVNLFEPDDGDVLRFSETSFQVRECEVNGERVDLAQYLRSRGLDHGKLPLVGDFAGAHVNVSLQSIDDAKGLVNLYAPVFPGVDYHLAKPVPDYAGAFRARLAEVDPAGVVLGCNCILNFLYGELEGKAIGGVQGPVTFGEIAYQLLNQTLVMIRIA